MVFHDRRNWLLKQHFRHATTVSVMSAIFQSLLVRQSIVYLMNNMFTRVVNHDDNALV
jgi:hypothetical protein